MHRLPLLVLLLSLTYVLLGCASDSDEGRLGLGNSPLGLPGDVGYALARGIVAVIDLAKSEIVGIHRVCQDDEFAEDFGIGPDGSLYFPIEAAGGSSAETIRVMDPATGRVIDEIGVPLSPRRIHTLPDWLAIVEHNLLPTGSACFACDVLDMKSNSLARTLCFEGIAGNLLCSPTGEAYIGILDVLGKYGGDTLFEFDANAHETVGDPITLRSGVTLETAALVTASKLYVGKEPAGQEPYSSLAVLDFPSGQLLGTIPVAEWPRHIVTVGAKAYVTHFSEGSLQSAQNETTVSVIDTTTDQVLKTLEVCPGPQHSVYSQSTGKVYVACVEGKISVIDTGTDTIAATIVCDDPRASGWGFSKIKVAS